VERFGVGLHSGTIGRVRIEPSDQPGFQLGWLDQPGTGLTRLHPALVWETQLCTALKLDQRRLATVEHLLAALVGTGLSQVAILVEGDEVPLLDGSRQPVEVALAGTNTLRLTLLPGANLDLGYLLLVPTRALAAYDDLARGVVDLSGNGRHGDPGAIGAARRPSSVRGVSRLRSFRLTNDVPDLPVPFEVTDADGDPIRIRVAQLPSVGRLLLDDVARTPVTVAGFLEPGQRLRYRPQRGTGVADSFSLTYSDPGAESGEELFLVETVVNPLVDTDGDGMPDAFEAARGLNPLVDDAAGDLDGDGIPNLREFAVTRTEPHRADTDGDGLADGAEIAAGTDPLDPDTDDDTGLQVLIDDTCDCMGRAKRALKAGKLDEALDILRSAGRSLIEAEVQ
jgi:hypothetical protein